MQLLDLINQAAGSGAIEQAAARTGLSPQQAQAGLQALLPALAGGMQKQAQGGGLESLLGGLLGGGAAPAPSDPAAVDHGNGILGQIFGSKDVSRTVADHASAQTGIGSDKLKLLLPIAATLLAGAMARQGGAGAGGMGGLGGLLGGLMGGMGGAAGGQPQAGGALGGLGSLLDRNGNGNPLDDILGMMKR